MNSKRAFFAMLVLAILLGLGSVALTYFGVGLLKQEGDKLTAQKLEQEVLNNRKAALANAERDIETYEPLEKISKSIVPQEKDQARTVREIVTIADEAGIPLSSIQFPESALGEVKKLVSSGSSSSSSSSSAAAPKKPVSNIDPNTTQLTPVAGTKGLYAMEITVQSDGERGVPYSRLLNFLERLEKNRRTAHVTNLTIQPSESNRNLVTFTVALNVYIKP